VGYVACMGEVSNSYKFLVGNPEGKITLEWILGKQGGKAWIRFIWFRIGTSGRPCEHGNEPSGSIKRGEFVDWLSDY